MNRTYFYNFEKENLAVGSQFLVSILFKSFSPLLLPVSVKMAIVTNSGGIAGTYFCIQMCMILIINTI